MKQNFFAVDLGATSGRTILGTFIEGGLNLEEINRFPNHLIEVGGHFYWEDRKSTRLNSSHAR